MKITILISDLSGGGAERIAVDIADNLPSAISRNIVTILDTPDSYHHTTNRISLVKSQNTQITASILLSSFIHYLRYLQTEKPDISLSLLTYPNLLNILGYFITKSKPIISVHEMPSQQFTKGIGLIRHIIFTLTKYTNIDIIAVSQGVKKELMKIYNIPSNKITVIHNPINVQEIFTLSKESLPDFLVKKDDPYIITVGRLNQVKGQWHLIRAFSELRKKQPCTLLICGNGDLENDLKTLAEECGVADDVIFLGWQDNPYKYMAKSTVFVQSSISEALPNVLVESLACGCPVIAANCSDGIEEILGTDNTFGFITQKMSGHYYSSRFPLDEGEKDLLLHMEKILNDSKLHASMSLAGKERAKLFDLDVGIQKYVELFEQISLNSK